MRRVTVTVGAATGATVYRGHPSATAGLHVARLFERVKLGRFRLIAGATWHVVHTASGWEVPIPVPLTEAEAEATAALLAGACDWTAEPGTLGLEAARITATIARVLEFLQVGAA